MRALLIGLLCWGLAMPPRIALADNNDVCSAQVVPLAKGVLSPCTGYLFSPAKEHQIRLINDDYTFMQQQVDNLTKQKVFLQGQLNDMQGVVDSQKKEINIWRIDDIDNSNKLVQAQEGRGTRDFLFFGGGVLAVLIFTIIANSLRK